MSIANTKHSPLVLHHAAGAPAHAKTSYRPEAVGSGDEFCINFDQMNHTVELENEISIGS